jgi:hypothetical protein
MADTNATAAGTGVADLDALAGVVPEAEANVEPGVEAQASDDGDTDADAEGGDEAGDDGDEIELNLGGNPLRLKATASVKDAAAELQKFADQTWATHTRRSQEVAEKAKEVQARAEAVEKIQKMDDDAFSLFAAAKGYEQQAAQCAQELQQLPRTPENMDRYRFLSDDLASAKAAAASARAELVRREQHAEQLRTAEMRRQHEAGAQSIMRKIKGFDPAKVIGYMAQNYGVQEAEARNTWGLNPAIAEVAWKAMRYDELQSAAKKAKPASQPTPAEPTPATVRRTSAPRAGLDQMSPEQYHKMRMKQRLSRHGMA